MSSAIWDHTEDTGEHTPPDRLVLDVPTPDGWKAELT